MAKHRKPDMMNAHVTLLEVKDLSHVYTLARPSWLSPKSTLQALHQINFKLSAGKSLGIVGASGSGKSTLARLVMALEKPTQGQVLFNGQDLHALPSHQLREIRPHFQMVFQDPYSALDPRQTVLEIVNLDDEINKADLVITGEGCLDDQSLHGKVIAGVASHAAALGKPCVALAGEVRLGKRECATAGIDSAYSMSEFAGRERSMAMPAEVLSEVSARMSQTWGRR
jgi:ABC-type dipeptide/oligopeptide/nickel transport system ATPase subunit